MITYYTTLILKQLSQLHPCTPLTLLTLSRRFTRHIYAFCDLTYPEHDPCQRRSEIRGPIKKLMPSKRTPIFAEGSFEDPPNPHDKVQHFPPWTSPIHSTITALSILGVGAQAHGLRSRFDEAARFIIEGPLLILVGPRIIIIKFQWSSISTQRKTRLLSNKSKTSSEPGSVLIAQESKHKSTRKAIARPQPKKLTTPRTIRTSRRSSMRMQVTTQASEPAIISARI